MKDMYMRKKEEARKAVGMALHLHNVRKVYNEISCISEINCIDQ